MNNRMILAEGQEYSLDCYSTKLNNNVLVVGTSGAGKTRGIVIPNIMEATGSYIISDPKGNLYRKYKNYLKQRGYVVKKLDFTDPKRSCHYNFFDYIHDTQDIVKISHMLINNDRHSTDPFWDNAAQLMLQAMIAWLIEFRPGNEQNMSSVNKLLNAMCVSGDLDDAKTPLDRIFEQAEKVKPSSYACKTYQKFRVAASRTLRSILITANAKLGIYDTPEMIDLMEYDDVDIASIGDKKTALFVVVSDTDRSMDALANLFFTQAMNELCRHADKDTKDNMLAVPVRFILDDFATNCKIENFPRMIASIRSRGISTMLMIQSEGQLEEGYKNDSKTIIGNCDTYIYMGGNDLETAKSVAQRCDLPLKKILYMPVGTNWIFRRGSLPVNAKNLDLEKYISEKTDMYSQDR